MTVANVDRSLLIEGLGKGLRVIEAFSENHPRLTASQAGELAGLTRTAARRYLVSLVHFGYADTDGKQYWLLPSILRLGRAYLEAARLPRLVQPFLQRLSMQTGETANLSVLDGADVVYLSRSNSPRIVSIGFQPGARVPAHVVSAGYAALSAFNDEQLDAWLATRTFARFTPQTLTEPAQVREAVVAARRLGYWCIEQFIDTGLAGIAVALTDRKGQCAGAISVTYQMQAYPAGLALTKLLPPLQDVKHVLRGVI